MDDEEISADNATFLRGTIMKTVAQAWVQQNFPKTDTDEEKAMAALMTMAFLSGQYQFAKSMHYIHRNLKTQDEMETALNRSSEALLSAIKQVSAQAMEIGGNVSE